MHFVTVRAGETGNGDKGYGIMGDFGFGSYTILGSRGQATVSRRGKAGTGGRTMATLKQ